MLKRKINMTIATQTKQTISASEFDKKVEIEMEYLIYMDRMSKPEALAKAKQTVSAQYQKE